MFKNFHEKITAGRSDDIVESAVLKMMKKEKIWKFSPDYRPTCDHPPVINSRGKCAFCTVIDNMNAKLQQKINETAYLLDGLKRQKMMHGMGVYMEQPDRPDILPLLGVVTESAVSRAVFSGVSARAQAKAAGEKWYTPSEPCSKCGTLSQRYVANGRCRGCKQ